MTHIQIYARLRPAKKKFKGLAISGDNSTITVSIGDKDNILKRPEYRHDRAPASYHQFKFTHVFPQKSSQEEVFDKVAGHMTDSFLSGYNGTIFAYGQTSSGKTHTIEGNSKKFADRGLIPRAISYVYKEMEKKVEQGQEVSIHLSYMEIYQDVAYDLLNPGMRAGSLMVTLPKVIVTEGPGGDIRVRNLSLHLAASEEVAQSLLFQGSTCRKVAETSMNQCSSRSHTIFTLCLTVKTPNSEIITRSKLNLVDLAGSERVARTKADGRILREAKHINLSLHHLEHVIVNLQQMAKRNSNSSSKVLARKSTGDLVAALRKTPESRQQDSFSTSHVEHRGKHIPYRNSMLTLVLKDSLGGNCLTAMIATISADERNILESISTCKFSQRVACISNIAKCNEELDDKVVIQKLKQRIKELENERKELKDEQSIRKDSSCIRCGQASEKDLEASRLSHEDQNECHSILHQFFHGTIENPIKAGIDTIPKFHESLLVLRKIVMHALDIKDKQNESPLLPGKQAMGEGTSEQLTDVIRIPQVEMNKDSESSVLQVDVMMLNKDPPEEHHFKSRSIPLPRKTPAAIESLGERKRMGYLPMQRGDRRYPDQERSSRSRSIRESPARRSPFSDKDSPNRFSFDFPKRRGRSISPSGNSPRGRFGYDDKDGSISPCTPDNKSSQLQGRSSTFPSLLHNRELLMTLGRKSVSPSLYHTPGTCGSGGGLLVGPDGTISPSQTQKLVHFKSEKSIGQIDLENIGIGEPKYNPEMMLGYYPPGGRSISPFQSYGQNSRRLVKSEIGIKPYEEKNEKPKRSHKKGKKGSPSSPKNKIYGGGSSRHHHSKPWNDHTTYLSNQSYLQQRSYDPPQVRTGARESVYNLKNNADFANALFQDLCLNKSPQATAPPRKKKRGRSKRRRSSFQTKSEGQEQHADSSSSSSNEDNENNPNTTTPVSFMQLSDAIKEPSPASGLSSGFGSLRDEDGSNLLLNTPQENKTPPSYDEGQNWATPQNMSEGRNGMLEKQAQKVVDLEGLDEEKKISLSQHHREENLESAGLDENQESLSHHHERMVVDMEREELQRLKEEGRRQSETIADDSEDSDLSQVQRKKLPHTQGESPLVVHMKADLAMATEEQAQPSHQPEALEDVKDELKKENEETSSSSPMGNAAAMETPGRRKRGIKSRKRAKSIAPSAGETGDETAWETDGGGDDGKAIGVQGGLVQSDGEGKRVVSPDVEISKKRSSSGKRTEKLIARESESKIDVLNDPIHKLKRKIGRNRPRREHEDKNEEEMLARNIKILNLRILKEQLTSDLAEISEVLAHQHVKVQAARREGDDGAMELEIKAQQHLQHKQFKIHQRLKEIGNEILALRTAATSDENLTQPPSLRTLVESMMPATPAKEERRISVNEDIPTSKSRKKQKKEEPEERATPTKHKKSVPEGRDTPIKRTKEESEERATPTKRKQRQSLQSKADEVKLQFEELEMEKELALKEAATRKKIQDLKQQLFASQETTSTRREEEEEVVPSHDDHMISQEAPVRRSDGSTDRVISSHSREKDHVTSHVIEHKDSHVIEQDDQQVSHVTPQDDQQESYVTPQDDQQASHVIEKNDQQASHVIEQTGHVIEQDTTKVRPTEETPQEQDSSSHRPQREEHGAGNDGRGSTKPHKQNDPSNERHSGTKPQDNGGTDAERHSDRKTAKPDVEGMEDKQPKRRRRRKKNDGDEAVVDEWGVLRKAVALSRYDIAKRYARTQRKLNKKNEEEEDKNHEDESRMDNNSRLDYSIQDNYSRQDFQSRQGYHHSKSRPDFRHSRIDQQHSRIKAEQSTYSQKNAFIHRNKMREQSQSNMGNRRYAVQYVPESGEETAAPSTNVNVEGPPVTTRQRHRREQSQSNLENRRYAVQYVPESGEETAAPSTNVNVEGPPVTTRQRHRREQSQSNLENRRYAVQYVPESGEETAAPSTNVNVEGPPVTTRQRHRREQSQSNLENRRYAVQYVPESGEETAAPSTNVNVEGPPVTTRQRHRREQSQSNLENRRYAVQYVPESGEETADPSTNIDPPRRRHRRESNLENRRYAVQNVPESEEETADHSTDIPADTSTRQRHKRNSVADAPNVDAWLRNENIGRKLSLDPGGGENFDQMRRRRRRGSMDPPHTLHGESIMEEDGINPDGISPRHVTEDHTPGHHERHTSGHHVTSEGHHHRRHPSGHHEGDHHVTSERDLDRHHRRRPSGHVTSEGTHVTSEDRHHRRHPSGHVTSEGTHVTSEDRHHRRHPSGHVTSEGDLDRHHRRHPSGHHEGDHLGHTSGHHVTSERHRKRHSPGHVTSESNTPGHVTSDGQALNHVTSNPNVAKQQGNPGDPGVKRNASSPSLHTPTNSKARLTLPPEVKETKYMTSLQKQKSRVSKIRRCIVAATVIQRAWRAHRSRELERGGGGGGGGGSHGDASYYGHRERAEEKRR